MNKRSIGKSGEILAIKFLQSKGFTLIDQNVYSSKEEIDLIMSKGESLYFVEVKYRQSLKYGYPIEAMTALKCKHFKRACVGYLSREKIDLKYHISFLGILKTEEGYEYNWVKDFFT